jgi:glucose/arabinose dehydrogenase
MHKPVALAALAVVTLASALLLGACTSPAPSRSGVPPTGIPPSALPSAAPTDASGPVKPVGTPKVIATGFDVPWSMLRLSTGSTLVSERQTALIKEVQASGAVRVVGKVPGVVPNGEGGLLGLATKPGDESWLYVDMSTGNDNRVVRFRLHGTAGTYSLGAKQTLLTGLPTAGNHDGGRLKFGPDGDLYITAGDATDRERAQDLDYLGGKILRIEPDGGIPSDNPFPGSPIWSYGHRNPQGIAWDSTGRMWASEFGQDTWDELNIITPGKNYGWPIVEGKSTDSRFVNPVLQWATADASPSGLLYTHDTLFLAALRGERLWAIYPGASPVAAVPWFTGRYGRLRDVIDGPAGTIWILTNNTARGTPKPGDDQILQVQLAPL